MKVYILTVLLMTTNPPKLFVQEEYNSYNECMRWAKFYSEYPFIPKCEEKK